MKYGLVLAGGGVRGAYHVGVWKALEELGIEISVVTGVSIGAINGALLVQGNTSVTEELWNKIAIDDIVALPQEMAADENLFKVTNLIKIAKEIYKNDGLDMSPLEKLLESIVDEDKIRNSPIDFGIATFSLTEKNEMYLFKEDIPKGELIKYLMASACLPGFKTMKIGENKFVDGGVSNNMPVNMLLEKDVDNIIAVDVKGVGFYRSFNLAGKNVINVKCSRPQTGTMDFNREGIGKSMKEGYFDCMKTFGRLDGELYSFTAGNYRNALKKYSKELINGIENAANIFGINSLKIYTFEELVKVTMSKYAEYAQQYSYSLEDNVFEKLRKADDNKFVIWLVDVLENGKSDFIKGKLSILGSNYDAASAILYFKRQK